MSVIYRDISDIFDIIRANFVQFDKGNPMKIKHITFLTALACAVLTTNVFSITYGVVRKEADDWAPKTDTTTNPSTGNQVDLVFVKYVTPARLQAEYAPAAHVVHPDNLVCQQYPEACIKDKPSN